MCKNNKDLVKVLWYDWNEETELLLKQLKEEGKINYDNNHWIIIIKSKYTNEVIRRIKDIDKELNEEYWLYDFLDFFIAYNDCSEESITSFFLNKTISLGIYDVISGIDDSTFLTDEIIKELLTGNIGKTLKDLLHKCYVSTFQTVLDTLESEIKEFKLSE